MDKERRQAFSVRITKSNRTELIAIMYELMELYLEDAQAAREADQHELFKQNIRAADQVLAELMGILDFKYEISGNLYQIYGFCREQLAASLYRYDCAAMQEARALINQLGKAFHELAAQDTSEALMSNTEEVAYGMTYGRSDISETYTTESNRGFFA